MMPRRVTGREFNRDTAGAKKAAQSGPVYVTDRGRPSHVLLSFAEYQRLAAAQPGIVELLGDPAGIEDITLDVPLSREVAAPARFD